MPVAAKGTDRKRPLVAPGFALFMRDLDEQKAHSSAVRATVHDLRVSWPQTL
jgi:hypothetical protein